MVSRLADIEYRIEGSCLAGGRKDSCHASLQIRNLRSHRVVGGILQPGIEIAFLLQVKQPPHLFCGSIFKSGALINGKHPGFSVSRMPPGLNTFCLDSVVAHTLSPLLSAVPPRLCPAWLRQLRNTISPVWSSILSIIASDSSRIPLFRIISPPPLKSFFHRDSHAFNNSARAADQINQPVYQ